MSSLALSRLRERSSWPGERPQLSPTPQPVPARSSSQQRGRGDAAAPGSCPGGTPERSGSPWGCRLAVLKLRSSQLPWKTTRASKSSCQLQQSRKPPPLPSPLRAGGREEAMKMNGTDAGGGRLPTRWCQDLRCFVYGTDGVLGEAREKRQQRQGCGGCVSGPGYPSWRPVAKEAHTVVTRGLWVCGGAHLLQKCPVKM